mmetsp:Transcript_55217/g.109656  ORF Transcript_55217/g.109656 Transcript_55217/m.109656 type:complete len:92 (+) Transcript_55217:2429-2704(+)
MQNTKCYLQHPGDCTFEENLDELAVQLVLNVCGGFSVIERVGVIMQENACPLALVQEAVIVQVVVKAHEVPGVCAWAWPCAHASMLVLEPS